MGKLSVYAENKILDHILGTTSWPASPATIYLAVSTTDFTEAGTGGSEPSGNGYVRKAITFGAPSSRAITQNADVTYDEATGDWGTIAYYGIFDAESSGNMLAFGALSAGVSVTSGKTLSFPSGQCVITGVSSQEVSNYLANAILNHIFRDTEYTAPTIYAGLAEAAIADDTTGGTVDEMDMTGYSRVAHSAWDTAANSATENTGVIDFGQWTAGGPETVEAAFLIDSSSGAGNILFYDNAPSVSISTNDTVQIADGAFDITLA